MKILKINIVDKDISINYTYSMFKEKNYANKIYLDDISREYILFR